MEYRGTVFVLLVELLFSLFIRFLVHWHVPHLRVRANARTHTCAHNEVPVHALPPPAHCSGTLYKFLSSILSWKMLIYLMIMI